MLGQLCPDESMGSVERSAKPLQKKTRRSVSLVTFSKWQRELNKEYESLVWLKCEKDSATGSVVALFCEVVVNTRTGYSLYGITRLFGSEDRPT